MEFPKKEKDFLIIISISALLNASENYIMYYKGRYENRIKVIAQLCKSSKKDSMRNGQQETFIRSLNAKRSDHKNFFVCL